MKGVLKFLFIIGVPIGFLTGCDKTGGNPPGTEWSQNQVVGLTILCIVFGLWLTIFIVQKFGAISSGDCFGGCGACSGGSCGSSGCGSGCGSSCGGCGGD